MHKALTIQSQGWGTTMVISLDAADVFAAIAVFQALRMGLITLPIAVTALFNVVLSTGRIQRYLILPRNPERATFAVSAAEVEDGKEEDEEELLRFSNVALSWSHAEDAQADAEAEAAAAGRGGGGGGGCGGKKKKKGKGKKGRRR